MVALVMFCLCLVVLPISALQPNSVTGRYNGSVIMNGGSPPTVFIGESGLNLAPALCQGTCVAPAIVPVGYMTKIGWWGATGSGAFPANPSRIVEVGTSYTNFEVSSATFGSSTGTWYLLDNARLLHIPIFMITDPQQAVTVVDLNANQGSGQDMSGQSVVRGTVLTFKLDTNLATFTSGGRMSPFANATINGITPLIPVVAGAAPDTVAVPVITLQTQSPTQTIVITMQDRKSVV